MNAMGTLCKPFRWYLFKIKLIYYKSKLRILEFFAIERPGFIKSGDKFQSVSH